jgi:hypothetical protein
MGMEEKQNGGALYFSVYGMKLMEKLSAFANACRVRVELSIFGYSHVELIGFTDAFYMVVF